MKLDQCQSLSCDDLVLLDANNAVKKQYADPLLKTAGQEQAFTACLSQQQSFDGFYLAHMETWEDPNHRERICVEEEGLLACLDA